MRRSWSMPDGRPVRILAVGVLLSSVAACATAPPPAPIASSGGRRVPAYNRPYQVHGQWYTPAEQPHYDVVGIASWYSYEAHNRTTADGEPFDVRWATAAHKTLPLPSYLEVTNLDNGRRIRVRLNDRGPFVSGRLIDLSRGAAEQLGFLNRGTAHVRVRYLGPAPSYGRRDYLAEAEPAPPSSLPISAAPAVPLAEPSMAEPSIGAAPAAGPAFRDPAIPYP